MPDDAYPASELPIILDVLVAARPAADKLAGVAVRDVAEHLGVFDAGTLGETGYRTFTSHLFTIVQLARMHRLVLAGVARPLADAMEYVRFGEAALRSLEFDHDGDAWPREEGGSAYRDVRVFLPAEYELVQAAGGRLTPLTGLTEAAVTSLPTPGEGKSKGNGGPEPRHGDEFIQEIVRLALTPDGFDTRKQLEEHMKGWCSRTMGDSIPSDRSIERWVRRYCPPELPDR